MNTATPNPAQWADLFPGLDADVLQDFLGDCTVPANITEIQPETSILDAPPYREKEWMRQQAAGIPNSIGIFRGGSFYDYVNSQNQTYQPTVCAVPYSPLAAFFLRNYLNTEQQDEAPSLASKAKKHGTKKKTPPPNQWPAELLPKNLISCATNIKDIQTNVCLEKYKVRTKDGRLYFSLSSLDGPRVEDSFLYQHLKEAGFNVIVSPSLNKWIRARHRKTDRLFQTFDLPEIQDTRPLFERVETGTVLECIKDSDPFIRGHRYCVIHGTRFLSPSQGQPGANNSGSILLRQQTSTDLSESLEWSELKGPTEAYFKLAEEEKENISIYDPLKSIPVKSAELFQYYKNKLQAMDLPIYDHVAYDAAQMAVKGLGLHGKPQRMGKSSEAIATSLLWGSKRKALICPSIGRPNFIKELQRLGIKDYVVVKNEQDLYKPGKFHIFNYDWLAYKKDDRIKTNVLDPNASKVFDHRGFLHVANCPHCNENLFRRTKTLDGKECWTTIYGYRCINPKCTYTVNTKRKWCGPKVKNPLDKDLMSPPPRIAKRGYVDLERAKHVYNCIIPAELQQIPDKAITFSGRQCKNCGYVEKAWRPPMIRRVRRHRWGTVILDEVHMVKNANTERTKAALSLKAKHRLGMTGTLMPNGPEDPYWPLHWILSGGTPGFPYFRGGLSGKKAWNADFVNRIDLVDPASSGKTKRYLTLPYINQPKKFWKLMARTTARRSWEDPLVTSSLEKLGLHYPSTSNPKIVLAEPEISQAKLLIATLDKFHKNYEVYKAKQEEAEKALSTHTVLTSMNLMRLAATCPDAINDKLSKNGLTKKLYTGVPGGGKVKHVYNICYSKAQAGEKTVVFAYHRKTVDILADALSIFNPIKFDVRTMKTEEDRMAAQEKFNDPDSPHQVFVCTLDAIQVAADLSGANTVVCTDLLWVPGNQDQACKRIMKPMPVSRTCDVYFILLQHSIDSHIYNVFYSKQSASEQALDRMVKTKKEQAFDVQWFVSTVMSDKQHIIDYLLASGEEEEDYVPMLNMLWADSDELSISDPSEEMSFPGTVLAWEEDRN